MEREINEFRQTRERQLQEQAMRMREGIVKEITDVVMEKVKANRMDLVFDKSGMSLNGVPVLMYSRRKTPTLPPMLSAPSIREDDRPPRPARRNPNFNFKLFRNTRGPNSRVFCRTGENENGLRNWPSAAILFDFSRLKA